MSSSHPLIKGTIILTISSILAKIMGFFYKIFLSRIIGAEGLGIYQLTFPVYALCLTIAVSGIQTGISRCCSASLSSKSPEKAYTYFFSGLGTSCLISLLLSIILYHFSEDISTLYLKEPRCEELLRFLSLCILPAAIHTCINSWYFAKKQTEIPAFSQFLEQGVRILTSWIIYQILLSQNLTPTPLLAILGILAGEIVAALLSVICFFLHSGSYQTPASQLYKKCTAELYRLSFPLTMNRLLLTILQSVESILIPLQLTAFGLSSAKALELYGILTGMTIPFLLFPSSLTTSASTILMPMVAGEQAQGHQKKIRATIEQTIKYCFLLGIFATGIFFLYGKSLGDLIYQNAQCGIYLKTLSLLCPFFYLTGTLSSILTGLGKTGLCLIQNICALSIRILCVLLLVPKYGMTGYLWGLLFSQFFVTLFSLFFIYRQTAFHFSMIEGFFLPFCALIISSCTSYFSYRCIFSFSRLPQLLCVLISMGFCGICFLLLLSAMGLLDLRALQRFKP